MLGATQQLAPLGLQIGQAELLDDLRGDLRGVGRDVGWDGRRSAAVQRGVRRRQKILETGVGLHQAVWS